MGGTLAAPFFLSLHVVCQFCASWWAGGSLTIDNHALTYNEATREVDYYPILATIVHQDQVVQLLTIAGETIVTTPNHPFYTIAEAWVPAGQLQFGDLVRRADGRYGMVEAITFVYQPQPMYNLTVDTAHTYFVGDGQWLVHNDFCKWQFPDPGKANQAARRGWNNTDIQNILDSPVLTRKNINKATGNSATYYYRPDGHYVVRDDVTGDIFHVSNTHDPKWVDPNTNQPIKPIP